jgi:hypothetical protein
VVSPRFLELLEVKDPRALAIAVCLLSQNSAVRTFGDIKFGMVGIDGMAMQSS